MTEPFDEALPSRALLEAYTVPEAPSGFTDRVMASMHSPVVAGPSPRPSAAPWIVAAVASACAVVAVTLLVTRSSVETPTPVERDAMTPGSPPTPTTTVVAPLPVAAQPVTPPPAPLAGDLVIVTIPRDADVRVDGVAMTNAAGGSPHVRTNLDTGVHRIEVTRDGFVPWRTTIDLPARALNLEVVLDPAAPVTPSATSPIVTTPAITPRSVAPSTARPRRPPRKASSPAGSVDLKDPFNPSSDDSDPEPPPSTPFR